MSKNHACEPLFDLKFPSLIGLNFNDLLTTSYSLFNYLFCTTFCFKPTLTHGIFGTFSSSATGYLLNILGCHVP